eukprot:CAMPEP_0119548904 /NCGR_PEP_ID=MMETSP1352-20130426/2727_1 /TAXON_ID=265584 /ORGANISM="Stauroneis constricta, Strain CCMP1120" /LENGTH=72 /DNA_ID=CAMNT_0007594311 /DNA_START=330 /DNA_END=545 /DNA_ORIENTATION=+
MIVMAVMRSPVRKNPNNDNQKTDAVFTINVAASMMVARILLLLFAMILRSHIIGVPLTLQIIRSASSKDIDI